MAKIRLTKNEIKKQKDALKRFQRYLPTLLLKKQQLQVEILKIQKKIEDAERGIINFQEAIDKWVEVFSEKIDLKITDLVSIKKIETTAGNIAGTDIPVLKGVDFEEKEYDLVNTPLWLDFGIDALKKMIVLETNCQILQRQLDAVQEELRITTQRVNLFEKVKIPETKENIRKIQIYLGDMQTASVVIGKIAKEKIQKKEAILV